MPLLEPVFMGYVALMLGPLVAAACALFNALSLRRLRPTLVALAVGAGGWLGAGLVLTGLVAAGVSNPGLVLLGVRAFDLGAGALLAASQWGQVRGHRLLGGRVVPLLSAILVAFAATFFLPWRATAVLLGLWPVLLHE